MLTAKAQFRQLDAELPHVEAGEETLACLVSLVRAHAWILSRAHRGAEGARDSARARVEPELVESVAAQPVELPPQLGSQSGLELEIPGFIQRLQERDDVGEILVPAGDELQVDEAGEADDVVFARAAREIARLRVGRRTRSRAGVAGEEEIDVDATRDMAQPVLGAAFEAVSGEMRRETSEVLTLEQQIEIPRRPDVAMVDHRDAAHERVRHLCLRQEPAQGEQSVFEDRQFGSHGAGESGRPGQRHRSRFHAVSLRQARPREAERLRLGCEISDRLVEARVGVVPATAPFVPLAQVCVARTPQEPLQRCTSKPKPIYCSLLAFPFKLARAVLTASAAMPRIYLTRRSDDKGADGRAALLTVDAMEGSAATAIAASVPRSLELADWIYAAGLEARGWHDVTRVLAAALGATRCWLVATESGRSRIVAASDLAVAPGAQRPGSASAAGPGSSAGSEWAGDPPGDAAIELGGDEALRLVFERAPFAPEERDFVRMLGRHIVRSRVLARALARAEARGHLASAALDRMAMGVVILDGEGRVAHLNPAARRRLGTDCGVTLVADRLEFVNPELEKRLRALREREHETAAEPRRLASELLRAPRAGDKPPLEILAVSLDGLDLAEGGAAIALFLSDADHASETPASVLLRLYGLTAAEARVAGEVLRGSGIDEAAIRLGLKRETVRTHLKHIFAKVGTTRQADLVRLLLTGAAGVRWE